MGTTASSGGSWVRAAIEAGALLPDTQLPSENELCDRFGVSRVTVRRAHQTLEADGLIYRRQGLGSFVCDRWVSAGLVRLTDFVQDVGRAGVEAELARDTRVPGAPPPDGGAMPLREFEAVFVAPNGE